MRPTMDTLPQRWNDIRAQLRDYFDGAEWYEVVEFMEFCPNHFAIEETNRTFRRICNVIFAREKSGYRFVGN